MELFGIALHANLDRTVGLEFSHVVMSHDGQGALKPVAEVNTLQKRAGTRVIRVCLSQKI